MAKNQGNRQRHNDAWKCRHYASFASGVNPGLFDAMYWTLFLLVLAMLFCASWYYGRSVEAAEGHKPGSVQHRGVMRRCMYICLGCAAVSVPAVAIEVFALLALEFCDGEDLIALYWSTWTVIQVGSMVAIIGIVLSVSHHLRGHKHPPWTLALGTPVLVIAGLGNYLQDTLRRKAKSAKSRGNSESGVPSRSEQKQDGNDDEPRYDQGSPYQATLVGYTPEGGPILRFAEIPGQLDQVGASVLGADAEGNVVVVFRKGIIHLAHHAERTGPGPKDTRDSEETARPTSPVSGTASDDGNGESSGEHTVAASPLSSRFASKINTPRIHARVEGDGKEVEAEEV